jgi:hypothetical protein
MVTGMRIWADLARVAGVLSFVVALTMGGVATALFALVLLGLTLLRLSRVSPALDLATGSLLVGAAWCSLLDLYQRYAWLDVAVHAAATGLVAGATFRALCGAGVLAGPEAALPRPRTGVLVSVVSLGLGLAVLWEAGEWFGHTLVDQRIQTGYDDTIGDLVSGGLGALVAGLLLARPRTRRRSSPPEERPAGSVSVVIPVKDDAPALRRCLDHLAVQTVAPLEVVVVDNGSVDDSAAVAAAYGARVVPEPRPGIPAAAATGYDAAVGDIIARCDADSAPPPDWVERIVRGLERPGVEAVTGTGWFYDLPRGVNRVAQWAYLGTFFVSVYAALGHPALWGSNMAMRSRAWRQVSDAVHRDDPDLHDDMDLAFALGPGRTIRYDRGLRVGVSARCLSGRHQLARRLRRATRTLRVNWAEQRPWERWAARFSRSRGGKHVHASDETTRVRWNGPNRGIL